METNRLLKRITQHQEMEALVVGQAIPNLQAGAKSLKRLKRLLHGMMRTINKPHALPEPLSLTALLFSRSNWPLVDEALDLMLECELVYIKNHAIHSPFTATCIDDIMIITDHDLPNDKQPQWFLDPLWEAPHLARYMIQPAPGFATLDVGSGCGVLALLSAKRNKASHVTGIDLNLRALDVGRFNALLNGLENIEFLKSDLFTSLKGLKFDLVFFNSPTDDEEKFETLLRSGSGILAEFFSALPEYLGENGYCQINFAVNESLADPFSDRLRKWLSVHSASTWQAHVYILEDRETKNSERWIRGWLTLRRGARGFFMSKHYQYDQLAYRASTEENINHIFDAMNNWSESGSYQIATDWWGG